MLAAVLAGGPGCVLLQFRQQVSYQRVLFRLRGVIQSVHYTCGLALPQRRHGLLVGGWVICVSNCRYV